MNAPPHPWALARPSWPTPTPAPRRPRRSALSPLQWLVFMLNPPDDATARLMFQEGQADGDAWAKAQGWPTTSLE